MMFSFLVLHALYFLLRMECVLCIIPYPAYSSAVSLQALVVNEKHVITTLETLLQLPETSEEEAKPVKSYIDLYHTLFSNNRSIDEVILHPVAGYHFLKNVIRNWDALMDHYKNKDGVILDYLKDLKWHRKEYAYPREVDLQRVAASIARMQYMYQLPVTSLIEGHVHATDNTSQVFSSAILLNAWDCLYIGKAGNKHNYPEAAVTWLQSAIQLIEEGDHSADTKEVENEMSNAVMLQKTFYPELEQIMGKLCRGERLKDIAPDSQLSCRFLTRGNPYLKLAPFKVEDKSKVPPIMVFHQVLTRTEMDRFKQLATPHLFTSRVLSAEDPEGSVSFERTSEQYWVDQSHDTELYTRISQRISDATGLDTAPMGRSWTAETFQVLNYGIGGLYLTHGDFLYNNGNEKNDDTWLVNGGDRIATFLIYLSDVEAGGGTVFPKADVLISPTAGSAAFWYNLHKDGKPDELTRHGGCPVLYGSKWISNKWMHLNGQYSHRCGLTPKVRHDLL